MFSMSLQTANPASTFQRKRHYKEKSLKQAKE